MTLPDDMGPDAKGASVSLDELQRKAAELQAILRALPDLFFRLDADGRFLDFSAPSISALYTTPEAFLGKRPAEVLPAELAERMERARADAHATGGLVTLEYELPIAGSLQYFEARYVPFIEGQTIALVRNVSDQRQAELALRASEERLRESHKIEAVGRLAGGVAHDFNNLLMVIQSYGSVIARQLGPEHPSAPALEEIQKAGQRANALTKQLLALSQKQPSERVVLDLGEILHDMHSMLARVIRENIDLGTRVEGGLGRVLAARSQLEQVVLNLVLNARDAMPLGGQLVIQAANVAADGEAAAGPSSHVELRVQDTGSGMSPSTQSRMFEPFFTTKAHGTGLGLFIVGQIVAELGGTLAVESAPGAGTSVVLRLPAVQGGIEVAPLEPRASVPGGSETVLVAEDDEAVRTLLVDSLGALGYRVLAAANASEALALVRSRTHSIDVLLTDVVMPGVSGWELGAAVALLEPGCRTLYMSGHAIERSGSDELPFADLLEKPFTPEALALRLRELLDRER